MGCRSVSREMHRDQVGLVHVQSGTGQRGTPGFSANNVPADSRGSRASMALPSHPSVEQGGQALKTPHQGCARVCVLSCVRLFATPWTIACQALLSMGFSRQEYWSSLPFSPPVDLPDPGIKARYLHCKQILYSLSH